MLFSCSICVQNAIVSATDRTLSTLSPVSVYTWDVLCLTSHAAQLLSAEQRWLFLLPAVPGLWGKERDLGLLTSGVLIYSVVAMLACRQSGYCHLNKEIEGQQPQGIVVVDLQRQPALVVSFLLFMCYLRNIVHLSKGGAVR